MRRVRAAAWGLLALALLGAGCGSPKTQEVHPQLVPPKSSYDFGPVPVLNARPQDIPLLNVGRASLTVSGAVLRPASPSFQVSAAPATVDSGATGKVTVTFTPPAEQAYSGTLVITTDDPTTPTVTVTLTGSGSTRAVMSVSPSPVVFGRVPEGTADLRALTVSSSGSADLILSTIEIAPGTTSAFSFLGSVTTPATVKTGGTLQLTVKYAVPAGAASGADGGIHLHGTDPDTADEVVPLVGGINRAPAPVIAPLGNGAPGRVVTLDGSGSNDPDSDYPLSYHWTLVNKPLGSSTQIANPAQALTQMTLDPQLPGEYDISLDLTDAAGAKSLQPARASIVATPQQELLIEMFQDNPNTDLDLHFLRTTSSPVGQAPDDCFYENPNPAWGPADAGENPHFNGDVLTGYGPEVTGYDSPLSSTFRVVVFFTNDHLNPNPVTSATVRIYVFGVEQAQLTRALQKQGDVWAVADIQWPGGTITPLP